MDLVKFSGRLAFWFVIVDRFSSVLGGFETWMDIYKDINKVTLVPAGASVGKRGKGAGFYCKDCNLTFKDSIQYMDHLNSRQHLDQTGQSTRVEKASLADVKARIAMLAEKVEKPYDIKEAIAKAQGESS